MYYIDVSVMISVEVRTSQNGRLFSKLGSGFWKVVAKSENSDSE